MQPENIQFKIKVKKRWSRHKNRTVVRKEKNRTTSLIYSWPSDPFLSPTYDSSSKLSRKLKLKTNSPGTLKLKTTKFPRMLKMKISTATSRSSCFRSRTESRIGMSRLKYQRMLLLIIWKLTMKAMVLNHLRSL